MLPRKKFSQLSREERLLRLIDQNCLSPEEATKIEEAVSPEFSALADTLIENALGCQALPFGVAPDVVVDGKTYFVPMSIEETSVVAAAASAAKVFRLHGCIETSRPTRHITGQIHFMDPKDADLIKKTVLDNKTLWITKAHQKIIPGMFSRGGGIKDIYIRELHSQDKKHQNLIVTILLDPKDAMGANIINQVCEFLKREIEATCPHEQGTMAILSNLNDQATIKCQAIINQPDADFAKRMEAGSRCAELDPHRAATHNKGIFNAIDAVLIATGNDWRAVEAGAHAFAARKGKYKPLSTWRYENNMLIGTLEVPIVAGIVGGVTNVHPLAKLGLKILKIKSADELERVVAATGLLQNFAALRALVTEGITPGHMKLHIRNWLYALSQSHEEFVYAEQGLQKQLTLKKRVTVQDVEKFLSDYRQKKGA